MAWPLIDRGDSFVAPPNPPRRFACHVWDGTIAYAPTGQVCCDTRQHPQVRIGLQVPSAHTLVTALVSGVLLGGLLAITALGLSLVLGVMRLINLVHGELVIAGAYLGYVLLSLVGKGVQAPLLTTFGLSVIAQNLFVLVFSADTRSLGRSYATAPLHLAGLEVPAIYAISFAVALVVVGGVHLLVQRTGAGREIRAAAEDPVAAAVLGVDVGRVYARTYALATACAGVGGVLVGLAFSFEPTTGTSYLLSGFAVVVLGGLGSVLGTLIGGVGLGVIESLGGAVFGDGYRDFIGLVVFIAFLALRPQGVLGRADR